MFFLDGRKRNFRGLDIDLDLASLKNRIGIRFFLTVESRSASLVLTDSKVREWHQVKPSLVKRKINSDDIHVPDIHKFNRPAGYVEINRMLPITFNA